MGFTWFLDRGQINVWGFFLWCAGCCYVLVRFVLKKYGESRILHLELFVRDGVSSHLHMMLSRTSCSSFLHIFGIVFRLLRHRTWPGFDKLRSAVGLTKTTNNRPSDCIFGSIFGSGMAGYCLSWLGRPKADLSLLILAASCDEANEIGVQYNALRKVYTACSEQDERKYCRKMNGSSKR